MKKNKTWLRGFAAGIGVSAAVGGTLFYVQYGTLPLIGDSVVTGKTASKAARIERLVEKNYLEDVESESMAEGMYAGMLASLGDPYSGYFSEENYKKLMESTEGKYTGIGLSMQQDTETKEITVYECFEGSPAEQAGVKEGDVIYKVGDRMASGKCRKFLTGLKAGKWKN